MTINREFPDRHLIREPQPELDHIFKDLKEYKQMTQSQHQPQLTPHTNVQLSIHSDNVLGEYTAFVISKVALPHLLIDTEFHLLHCALGLATEFLEYNLSETTENEAEELGDLLFYLIYTARTLSVTIEAYPEPCELNGTAILEEFLSLIKKHCIYGKDKLPELQACFKTLWASFCQLGNDRQFLLSELITSNKEKLNKRYTSSFTTEESETRRDKA